MSTITMSTKTKVDKIKLKDKGNKDNNNIDNINMEKVNNKKDKKENKNESTTEVISENKSVTDTLDNEPIDPTRLLIKNIPYSYHCDDLKELFSKYNVRAKICYRKINNSKGFGFIKFNSNKEYLNAIEYYNNNPIIIDNRQINISTCKLNDKYKHAFDTDYPLIGLVKDIPLTEEDIKKREIESKKPEVKKIKTDINIDNKENKVSKRKIEEKIDEEVTEEPSTESIDIMKFLNADDDEIPIELDPETPAIEAESKSKKSKVNNSKEAKNAVINFNIKLAEYAKDKELGIAMKEFKRMKKMNMPLSVYTYTSLINVCVRCGEVEMSRELLNEMKELSIEPNAITYTSFLKGLSSDISDFKEAMGILYTCEPNIRTFHMMMRACVRHILPKQILEIKNLMTKMKVGADSFCFSYLCLTYSYSGMIKEAWQCISKLAETFEDIDPTLFSTLAVACVLKGEFKLAEEYFSKVMLYLFSAINCAKEIISSQLVKHTEKRKPGDNDSHIKFEKLTLMESERECDRLTEIFTNKKAIKHINSYGPFDKSNIVYFTHTPLDVSKFIAPTIEDEKFFSKDTRLEICSGHGDWINAQALAFPDINWIGSELRMDRVWQIWNKIVLSNLKNIRIIEGDINAVTPLLKIEFSHIYVNFPEPPGWKGCKKNLVSQSLLAEIHRLLSANGHLIVVTDDLPYAEIVSGELKSSVHLFKSCFDRPFASELPEEYAGGSYFDRLWKNGNKMKRFFFKYIKI